jgi:NADPH:quinone reductase-like Zn-dependent oxidoreductase
MARIAAGRRLRAGSETVRAGSVTLMLAAYAVRTSPEDPLSGLEVGPFPGPHVPDVTDAPGVPDGWVRVQVRAAALNHHDLWSLRGVGLPEARLPMILGSDAAGIDEDGNEVIVHAVIADPAYRGDETLDPRRTLLSERYPGTLAEQVAVPRQNLVPKPPELTWAQAACLPTAWLTAYRMLFTQAQARPGDVVLVQGAGGGVATALTRLGAAAGIRMWVTSRDAAKRERARDLGAEQVFEAGARLPGKVDAVMETVGAATWGHTLRALRPGGTVVISGATSGPNPAAVELNRIFFLQLRILGSTMGTREELERLAAFCRTSGVRPVIDSELPLARARDGFTRMAAGDLHGKVVLTVD